MLLSVFFSFLLTIHGLIHMIGFGKAYNVGKFSLLTKEIPKHIGWIWFITSLLFLSTSTLFLLNRIEWMVFAMVGVFISQWLIFKAWHDAKFGSIINVIIAITVLLIWENRNFENKFHRDVVQSLSSLKMDDEQILTDNDLNNLPGPIQKYLHYVGVVDNPKVSHVEIVMSGEMREKGKAYFPFSSKQVNFFMEPSRFFFMKATMFGIMIPGYHRYTNAKGSMEIRLFGLFPIADETGETMDKTETVTLFNDMCLFAPATLTDRRIQWKSVNDTIVNATFTNKEIKISAQLIFNNQGQLINFLSKDRTALPENKQYLFSTPILSYKKMNGFNLPAYGEAVWHYPEGKFTYGKFNIESVNYNQPHNE